MKAYSTSLFLIMSCFILATPHAFADERVSLQNESVTRAKKNKKSTYLEKFNSVNTYTLVDNQHEISAKAQYLGINYSAKLTSGANVADVFSEQSGAVVNAQYSYGISRNLSSGLNVNYKTNTQNTTVYFANQENKTTARFKGISSMGLFSNLGYDFKSFGLYTYLIYNPRLGTASYNENTEEGNSYNEQASVEAKTTFVFNSSDIKYGLNGNYNLAFEGEDENIQNGVTQKNKVTGGGGYGFGAFVEFSEWSHLNLSALYTFANSKKYLKPDGNLWSDSPSQQYVQVSSAMKLELNREFSVIPEASYFTLLNKKFENFEYDQVHLYNFSLGLRAAF